MKILRPTSSNIGDGAFTRNSVAYYWNSDKIMTEASVNEARFNTDPITGEYQGVLLEQAQTNLLLNQEVLATQSITVELGTVYTVQYYGTGTLELQDAYTSTLVGTGYYVRQTLTFTTTSTNLTLTVTGLVNYAQVEAGPVATSWIKTLGSPVLREADSVTGSGLIYSQAVDAAQPWNSGTTYSIGQTVTYNKKVWESLQDTNLNNNPETAIEFWLDTGYINAYAMLDQQTSTKSYATQKLSFVVKPGAVDQLALIDCDTAVIKVVIWEPTLGIVYQNTVGLSGAQVYDWYQYFFYDPVIKRTQVILQNLPSYVNCVVQIELSTTTGVETSVSTALFGQTEYIGATQYGASAGIVDYSVKETDGFGTITFVKRSFQKRLQVSLFVDNTTLNRVQRVLYNIRAEPVVWIASEEANLEEAAIVYGFYKEFQAEIAYPNYTLYSLEVEGLS